MIFTFNTSEGKVRKEATPELIEKAKKSPKAFGEIYDIYVKSIYNYFYYRLQNVEKAEDLTQEVFIKALEAIERYKIRKIPLSAWLFRIARNLLIDFFRKKEIVKERLEGKAISSERAKKEVEQIETASFINKGLSRIKQEHREVIVLKFIIGYSNKEVAEIMGKSENAVKLIQYRALRKMNKSLKGEVEKDEG
ncbi:MAG: sigma-70 family RNA polymerase sigma factor [Actinomycetia bacterium]|nr:sigma-70 family RNA polymerase sigma factor [Actinomycetes bacterium]